MAQFERPAPDDVATNGMPNTNEMLNPGKAFAVLGAAAQGAMRGNLELMSLASRRARAQMDLPRNVMACRTPAEFGELSVAFWRDAFQDYVACNQRLMAGWTQGLMAAGQGVPASTLSGITTDALRPFVGTAQEAGQATAEQPTEPWAWWRTDMKGLKPTRNGNGHHSDINELRVGP